jgi:hypothetical protein
MNRWFFAGTLSVLAALALSAGPAGADETQTLLAQIKKVGREGAGNVEAARAWKALVARGTPALMPILAAMGDDEGTSANWLRPAFDVIAERAVRDGKPLPKAALEKFLGATTNPRSARRLAYEWLVKVDKTAPDRFLPGMLHDPSPELRRDAVARVMTRAEDLAKKKEAKPAEKAYRQALAGACDQDQVDAITKALDNLGVKVDLQAHFGVVRSWRLAGPFDHHKGVGWGTAYPPEKGVDLAAAYKGKDGKEIKWSSFTTKDPYGVVDLNKVLGKSMGAVAYAYAVVESPKEQTVELRAGSPNGLKVFLNGKRVFAREEYHHGASLDQYAARGALRQGRNEILLKVCQNEQKENWAQEWKFQLRLCDFTGAAVPFTQDTKEKK